MLALGRALMAAPRLLMLDEPSLGLAPLIVRDILRNRRGAARRRRLDPAGRAECARGARNRRLRLCARNRRSRTGWRGRQPARQCAGAGKLSRRRALTAMASRIAGYDGVAVAVPVTVPYVRYSIRGAHWFVGARAEGAGRRRRHRQGRDRRPVRGELHAGARHRGRPDPAPRPVAALARPHPDGRRVRRDVACAAPRARCRRATPRSSPASPATPTTSTRFRLSTASFSQFARDAVYPYGAGGPNASFAFLTAYYMRTYGAKREDFGKLCVAQRTNALRNPNALFKKPLTLEEYLGARPVADPLHLFDCVMPCAGADAFLVMSEERARRLGLRARAARSAPSSGTTPSRRPGAAARRLGDGPRRALRAGGRRPRRHRLRPDLRRLSR